jgi:hypothetical protein
MRISRLLLVLPFTLCLTGCLSSYTLVKVNPNGTGTLEQTTMINPMMLGMAQGLGGENATKSKPPTVAHMFKEEELRAAATKMGTGVRYVSSQPAKAEGREGVTAIYAFDDVTKLTVNQNASSPSVGGASIKASSESPIIFKLDSGLTGAKVLSITMPEGKPGDQKPAKAQDPAEKKDMPPEALAMMKSMFQGAKIGIDVEVAGHLIKSNSPYVNGSRITLMEVDLGALMEDPATLQKLTPGARRRQGHQAAGRTDDHDRVSVEPTGQVGNEVPGKTSASGK